MTLYRKIGGIHWLSLGPFRLSLCKVAARTTAPVQRQSRRPRGTDADALRSLQATYQSADDVVLSPAQRRRYERDRMTDDGMDGPACTWPQRGLRLPHVSDGPRPTVDRLMTMNRSEPVR